MMELFLSPFMLTGAVFILAPLLGFIPTIVFLNFYFKLKRWPILLAAILWGAYTIYEYLMHVRVLCSGECNIRVDLLVIYPVLWTISVIAIVAIVRAKRKVRDSQTTT